MSQSAVKSALKQKEIEKKCGNSLYFKPVPVRGDYFIELPKPQTMNVWVDKNTRKQTIGQGVCLEMKYANENFTYMFCHIKGVRIESGTKIYILLPTSGNCQLILFSVKQGEQYIDAEQFIQS